MSIFNTGIAWIQPGVAATPGYFAILGDHVNYNRVLAGNLTWDSTTIYTEGTSTVVPVTTPDPFGLELTGSKLYTVNVAIRVDIISGTGDFTVALVIEDADGTLDLNPGFAGTVLDSHTETAPEFVIASLAGEVDTSVLGPQYLGVIYTSNGSGNLVNTNSGFIEVTE